MFRVIILAIGLSAGAGSVFVQAQAQATPFGLRIGMSRAELEAAAGPLESLGRDIVKLAKVPRPHDRFDAYMVIVSPTVGVCRIMGGTSTIQVNSFGDQLKEEFKTIVAQIDDRYGEGQTSDFLKAGSIWRDPDDWMMGLQQQERILGRLWQKPLNAPSLSGIQLNAEAQDRSHGYLRITFDSPLFATCAAESKKAQGSAF